MKRIPLVLLIVGFFAIQSRSQSVQWASKVIEFSTQLTAVQYSANQALGKPNVLPAAGQNPSAWTPNRPRHSEFIKLGFANPSQIQQIAIAESFNPGSLYKIYTYDEAGHEYLINTFSPMVIPIQGRMLNVFMEKTPYKVAAVKLEFDGKILSDYFSIDAVAISDSGYPVIADINLPELLTGGILIERLDENVNSEYTELNPFLSPDGKTLYFSRENHPGNVGGVNDKEDIWYSELGADGKWSLAKNMGPQFNNAQPNFISSVTSSTPDGKSVLILLGNKYLPNGKMLAGVSLSTNVDGKWTDPKPLKIDNDYNMSEHANYFLSNNRKSLIMSVEREDSRGGRDLYASFLKNDSSWTEPLNLGSIVNTVGEETAPFFAADDKTLYFSSNGFSGYGGSDVYMTKRLDDTWTNWSLPVNLGPEINSKQEDLFFNIPPNSDYGYYSRGITKSNADIYRIKMPTTLSPESIIVVKGKLVDSKTGEPLGAKIIFEHLPGGKEAGVTYSDAKTGEYEMRLPGGYLYGFRAEAKDYISENQNLDLRERNRNGEVSGKNISLAPVEKKVEVATIKAAPIGSDVVIQLNNVFFDFDKAILRAESFPELDRIVSLMTERLSMTVEIAGHTDTTGSEEYNLKLSQRRSLAVTNYLLEKGVSKDRITTTFFGESKPVDTTGTKSGNAKNRRVEFKIIKM